MLRADARVSVQTLCSLLNAVIGCVHKCLVYNREDKDNVHDVGGLFTVDCMKMFMSPLVDQVITHSTHLCTILMAISPGEHLEKSSGVHLEKWPSKWFAS